MKRLRWITLTLSLGLISPLQSTAADYFNNFGTPSRGTNVVLTSNWEEAEVAAIEEASILGEGDASPSDAAALGLPGAACETCGGGGCNDCCNTCVDCEACPGVGIELLSTYDSWRGFSDGSSQSNHGTRLGFNLGVPVPRLEDYGVGAQFGFSQGFYDWSGHSSVAAESDEGQQQSFFTLGLFKRAFSGAPVSVGLAYDWQVNNNFGVWSDEPTLGQWRYQIGYALNDCTEIGVWGTIRDRGASQAHGQPVIVSYRAITQVNFFLHKKHEFGADSWWYVGFPEGNSFGNPGSLGDITIGATGIVPMSDRWSLYADAMYLKPSANAGPAASTEETWNLSLGLVFYPRCNAKTRNVAGSCWMPYMPLANNSNFLVDSTDNF